MTPEQKYFFIKRTKTEIKKVPVHFYPKYTKTQVPIDPVGTPRPMFGKIPKVIE